MPVNETFNTAVTPPSWALMDAVKINDTPAAARLLGQGVNVDARDAMQNTALIKAAINNNAELVRLLIDNGASINEKNKFGNSALALAACYGYTEVVRVLIEKGADLNERNIAGKTVDVFAEMNRHPETVQLIREAVDSHQRLAREKAEAEAAEKERMLREAHIKKVQGLKELAGKYKLTIKK